MARQRKGKAQGTGGGSAGANAVTSTAAQDMLSAALQAASENISWSTSVAGSGLLAGFRTDCSGFVSWVLSKGGVNTGDATTVGLPSVAGMRPGIGSQVTVWNNATNAGPGGEGHVIINILGHWFESGGQVSPSKIRQMTTAEVQSELGVTSLTQLNSGRSPRDFVAFTPPIGGNKVGGSPVTSGAGAGTNLATVKSAAQAAGIPFNILWGVYGAESTFGTAYANDPNATTFGYFGLTSAGLWTPGMSFQQDAQTAAQLLSKLYAEHGNNWDAALMAYSGGGYGLAHVLQLAGSQAGKTAAGGTVPGGSGVPITRPGGQPTGQQPDTISPLFDAYSAEIDQPGFVPRQSVATGETQFTGWLGDLGSELENEAPWGKNPFDLGKGGAPGQIKSLFDNVSGGINSTADFLKWIAWIFHPRNILRGIEALIGVGLMGAGMHAAISNLAAGAGASSSPTASGRSKPSGASGGTSPRPAARRAARGGSGRPPRRIVRTAALNVAARTPAGAAAKGVAKSRAKSRGRRQAYSDLVGREAKQAEARGRSSVINRDLTKRQRSLARARAKGKDVRRKPTTGNRS